MADKTIIQLIHDANEHQIIAKKNTWGQSWVLVTTVGEGDRASIALGDYHYADGSEVKSYIPGASKDIWILVKERRKKIERITYEAAKRRKARYTPRPHISIPDMLFCGTVVKRGPKYLYATKAAHSPTQHNSTPCKILLTANLDRYKIGDTIQLHCAVQETDTGFGTLITYIPSNVIVSAADIQLAAEAADARRRKFLSRWTEYIEDYAQKYNKLYIKGVDVLHMTGYYDYDARIQEIKAFEDDSQKDAEQK